MVPGNTVSDAPGVTTLTEERSSGVEDRPTPDALFLIVVWSGAEPFRVGESLQLPPGEPGPWRIFGRGKVLPSDPHPRLLLHRWRPGTADPAPPLENPRVSRVQLMVRARGLSALEVTSVGRSRLYQREREVETCEVEPGGTIRIGNQLVMLCVRRPAELPPLQERYPPFPFGHADSNGLVGESAPVWQLRARIAFVAQRSGHVLIAGPSGSGKELVAHAIHALSPRSARPIISRNASTLPPGLIDAELFGNLRNFPNHGMQDRPGLVGAAHGSTLFLDEFAELPIALQPHLLRVLDDGEYQRLGESSPRHSDFRLVGATNREPSVLKEDLGARMKFHIDVPDLNARREDIPLLAAYLVREAARTDASVGRFFPDENVGAWPRLSQRLLEALVDRRYSTHVRELDNLLWESIANSKGDCLELTPAAPARRASAPPHDASDAAEGPATQRSTLPPIGPTSPEEPDAARIQACIDEHNGKLEDAWRALGLANRYALRRLVAKYGLEIRRRVK
jgi:two-component system nitrogen regulation response regulator GlnG/two-component system response regulator HydG